MWDQRYAEPGFAYGTAPNTFLRAAAEHIPPGEVLCLAAGEGRNAVFLAERGHAVTAVDSSAVGLRKAQELAAQRGASLDTVCADLNTWTLPEGRWSGVTSVFCHLPPPLRRRVHAQVVRALAPGGVFVLEAYTPDQLGRGTGGPPARPMLYTLDALREELAGLEWVHAMVGEREVVEGRFHTGLAAVVQVIARRP